MTRGYLVLEKSGKVMEAAYLSSDAYLSFYGEKILGAFAAGKEMELLEQINLENEKYGYGNRTEGITPGWYRKTSASGKGDFLSEYAYVLRGKKLFVYNYGELLFSTDREHAGVWQEIARNTGRFADTYLYDGKALCYEWKKERRMYKDLERRITSGAAFADVKKELRPEGFVPSILEDRHVCDSFYRPSAPAYQKQWHKGDASVTFIVSRDMPGTNPWCVCVQLPYVRMPVLGHYRTEKATVNAIRDLVKEKEAEMVRFAEVYRRVEDALRKTGSMDLLSGSLEKEAAENPWYGCDSFFSPENIRNNIRVRQ